MHYYRPFKEIRNLFSAFQTKGPSEETEANEFIANGERIGLGIPVTTVTRCQTDFLLLPDRQMICGQNSGEHCKNFIIFYFNFRAHTFWNWQKTNKNWLKRPKLTKLEIVEIDIVDRNSWNCPNWPKLTEIDRNSFKSV